MILKEALAEATRPAQAGTLAAALREASRYWETKGTSSRMMPIRAGVGVSLLGPQRDITSLSPSDGITLLAELGRKGLSRASVHSYYAAFRRMLALVSVSTIAWPSAKQPARKVREPMLEADVGRLRGWLVSRGYSETVTLLDVLRGTGMRVEVEALREGAWHIVPGTSLMRITGKGGHERMLPVPSYLTSLSELRLRDARRLSYAGHLRRWNQGVAELGISTRLPTPHAVRHLYATQAYERSGRNLRVVQELLGHADVSTTARYIGVDMDALRQGAGA